MANKPTLTIERLRELLDYNPDTGEFRRRIARANTHIGDVAGRVNAAGYRSICIDYKFHLAHRLAWLYVHGVWPINQIDHKNGDRIDNRICNLREATNAQNLQNQARPNLGVYPHKSGRWRAKIKINGSQRHLGYFDTEEEAAAAYQAAKAELHPFWSRS